MYCFIMMIVLMLHYILLNSIYIYVHLIHWSWLHSLIHRLITLPIKKSNYKQEHRFLEEMAVKNGFNLKTIHKLIRTQTSEQNKITTLLKIETSKHNKRRALTYTGNESTRLATTMRRIGKNIKIAFKTNNKLNNNTISSKTVQYNKYDSKGVYKLTSINFNKLYIGRTNRNFNTRF